MEVNDKAPEFSLANEEGKITVLQAGGNWQVLRVNDLGEEVHATPALSEGKIYVRTRGALCVASVNPWSARLAAKSIATEASHSTSNLRGR